MTRAGVIVALSLGVALLARGAAAAAAAPLQQDGDASGLYAALAATLDPSANREVPRLPLVSIDSTGDTTVVFAIRNDIGNLTH